MGTVGIESMGKLPLDGTPFHLAHRQMTIGIFTLVDRCTSFHEAVALN